MPITSAHSSSISESSLMRLMQQIRVTINFDNAPIITIINAIQEQSGIIIGFHHTVDSDRMGRFTINTKDETVAKAVDKLLATSPYTYKEIDGSLMIVNREPIEIKGKVVDSDGKPVLGATVISTSGVGAITDDKGLFSLTLPQPEEIEVSCVGYETLTQMIADSNNDLTIKMKADEMAVKDVVVTGIYNRDKESFTGSAATFTAKELKNIGGTNVLQSLKNLDPSFNMLEDNEYGSDPNHLPNIEIRGKSSLLGMREDLASDPNQPLFIVDGFESNLNTVYNLDMNRVQSITILKDAASTAIYGSKAANGVVVVETVKPTAGELRVSYNGTATISAPDLSSYNMMNAAEKLDFELLAGRFEGSTHDKDIWLKDRYNSLKEDIVNGVDTYWLAEPLRVGINHRHSVYLSGGSKDFQFNAGGSYNGVTGVMKQSDRESLSGNLDISYRKNKFLFSNKFSVSSTNTNDPLVSFSEFVNTNPYYKKVGDDGIVGQWLEYNEDFGVKSANPLYNYNLNSYNKGKQSQYTNNFIAEWIASNEFRVRAKFGMTRNITQTSNFLSPEHTGFIDYANPLDRGTYNMSMNNNSIYEGDLTFTYGKTFNEDHIVNLVAGGNIYSSNNLNEGYSAYGFPAGDFTYPSFSKGYSEYGSPIYYESVNKAVSTYLNGSYSYKNIYMMDVSYRLNGSSIFGTTRRWKNTWAVGAAWNLANESFIKDQVEVINTLKLRASIGNPGNQSFESFTALTSYTYDMNNFNYFGISSFINSFGNPNLSWQTTKDKNIGFDLVMFNNRLSVTADYYNKFTDPLLVAVNVPSSTGVTQETTNLGNQTINGFTASVNYYIMRNTRDQIMWNVRATLRTEKYELGGIGNALEALNKYGQTNSTLTRYYDGANPDDIWAVRSLGIDPATGRELFLNSDNEITYDYNYKDEAIVGNMRPKMEGYLGTNFRYKNITLDLSLNYRMGADVFNSALFYKVENLTASSYNKNLDKRAYEERWQEPGDIAKYKDIADASPSEMSSRFVERDNTLTLSSLRIGYEFDSKFMDKIGMSNFKIDAYTTDLFTISTVKSERGTIYPFARSFQFSLSANF